MKVNDLVQNCIKYLQSLDEKLFFMINGHPTSWLDRLVYWSTKTTFWIPLYGFLLIILMRRFKNKTWYILLLIVALITLCDQSASSVMKPLIKRLRPCLDHFQNYHVHVVGDYHGLYGFISSHASNTFGLVCFLCYLLNLKVSHQIVAYSWACLVSYARVYGGVHYPSDVLVGALVGIGFGTLVYKFYKSSVQDAITPLE